VPTERRRPYPGSITAADAALPLTGKLERTSVRTSDERRATSDERRATSESNANRKKLRGYCPALEVDYLDNQFTGGYMRRHVLFGRSWTRPS
jgi:hypothetical protein